MILCYYLAIMDNRSAADYTASADAMIFAGDYGGAVAECSDGLRRYPESMELYILKARAYLLSGDSDKALGTLDYGYKQTRSEIILEQRGQLAGVPTDDVEFIPLTGSLISAEEQGGSPEAPDLSDGGEAAMEPYYTDSPIRVALPNVSPPKTSKETAEAVPHGTDTDQGENTTESE